MNTWWTVDSYRDVKVLRRYSQLDPATPGSQFHPETRQADHDLVQENNVKSVDECTVLDERGQSGARGGFATKRTLIPRSLRR
jgi:hypothetical protein